MANKEKTNATVGVISRLLCDCTQCPLYDNPTACGADEDCEAAAAWAENEAARINAERKKATEPEHLNPIDADLILDRKRKDVYNGTYKAQKYETSTAQVFAPLLRKYYDEIEKLIMQVSPAYIRHHMIDCIITDGRHVINRCELMDHRDKLLATVIIEAEGMKYTVKVLRQGE